MLRGWPFRYISLAAQVVGKLVRTYRYKGADKNSTYVTQRHWQSINQSFYSVIDNVLHAPTDVVCVLIYWFDIYRVFTRSSKRPANVFKIHANCWTFAGCLLDRVNTPYCSR